MRATFRRDVELVAGPRGSLCLRRRAGPRILSIALVLVATALTVFDARVGRYWLAALHGLLGLGFIALLVRAEFDRFVVEGELVVRRWVSLSGLTEARLDARSISRVGVERLGKRARAWLETRSGEQYALIDGEAQRVEQAAERLVRAITFVAADPRGAELH